MAGRSEDGPVFRKRGTSPIREKVKRAPPGIQEKTPFSSAACFCHGRCVAQKAGSLCRKSVSPYVPRREGLRKGESKGRRIPPWGKEAFSGRRQLRPERHDMRKGRYFFLHATGAGALRRTAMHSARMLTAISSGVSAPMSSPMGACMRARSSSVKPLSLRPA